MIVKTPNPPYYAVIFTSIRTGNNEGYEDMASEMIELASKQKGFLGVESARNGLGITVSYWESLDSIKKWKANSRHLLAQSLGQSRWYQNYKTRICLVERDYEF